MLQSPGRVNLLRGNHETREIASTYGFKTEIMGLYSETVFDAFCHAFSWMPLAAIVNERIFCVHGGIGPTLHTVAQIEALERPIDGLLPDDANSILWSDPTARCAYFLEANARNNGVQYGAAAVRDFLAANDLELIIRAHECVDGVSAVTVPSVITVFSSSNYHIGTSNRSGVVIAKPGHPLVPHCYPPLEKQERANATFFTFARHDKRGTKLQKVTRSAGSFRVLKSVSGMSKASIGRSSTLLTSSVVNALRGPKPHGTLLAGGHPEGHPNEHGGGGGGEGVETHH
jgi:diadenosine tetraphosphatase ApaH/serine/threonine PP2A family protein phosphatase